MLKQKRIAVTLRTKLLVILILFTLLPLLVAGYLALSSIDENIGARLHNNRKDIQAAEDILAVGTETQVNVAAISMNLLTISAMSDMTCSVLYFLIV